MRAAPSCMTTAESQLAPSTPPPGWYPDPSGAGQRYWDGTAWTEHTAP